MLPRRYILPLLLLGAVILTFAFRSTHLWRDFVFVYDQGRDALAVHRILAGDITLIGPTTGLFGVYLGPFFYYFLTPLYVVGQGNPIIPAYFFVLLSALVVIPLFFMAKRVGGVVAGWLAVSAYMLSFVQFQFSRWLSNPMPLPMTALLLFYSALRALETRKWQWFGAVGLLLGICMQLEAANAFFLIPTLVIVLLIEYWLRLDSGKKKMIELNKKIWMYWDALRADWKLIGVTLCGFVVTLAPQMIFELKHGFPITRSLVTAFATTHEVSVLGNLQSRATLLFDLYAKGWFSRVPWRGNAFLLMLTGALIILFVLRKKIFSNQTFRVICVWFMVPLFFHLMYTGNHGNFWDYYIIGQYIPLYILISSILALGIARKGLVRIGSVVLIIFLWTFIFIPNAREWFGLSVPYQERISLSLQLDAIDWIHERSGENPFGMWAYTPSAQDDVYKYLFLYKSRYNVSLPVEHPEQTKHMYLIVEDDPNNPKRREAWISEMSSIGTIRATQKFGAVTVFEVIRK